MKNKSFDEDGGGADEEADGAAVRRPLELLEEENFMLKICAPMVRYSKLPFRTLVRQYGCDMAFTPMIVANSFAQSSKARENEFTTDQGDRPLIVQFAANNAVDFANATEYIYQSSDGVDLNCGCPQRWAIKEGYGACILNNPELIRDVVLQTRNRIPSSDYPISLKIRIQSDLQKTVDFCQKAEHTGVSWLTVHSRTPQQRKEPISLMALQAIKDSLRIPVVANGDVFTLEDAIRLWKESKANGIMAARGLLRNPAMYRGFDLTPKQCIKDWIRISLSSGTHFTPFHHHLVFMMEKVLPRKEKKVFNCLRNVPDVLDYLHKNDFLDAIPLHLPQEASREDTPVPVPDL